MQENRSNAADDSLPELPDDLNELVGQLAHFEAAPSTLDREQVMFEAGRTAALAELDRSQSVASHTRMRRILRMWQSAALLMSAVSVGLGVSLAMRAPEVKVVEWHSPPAKVETPSSNPAAEVVPPALVQWHPSPLAEGKLAANSPGTSSTPRTTGPLHARGLALDESLNLANGFPRTLTPSQGSQNTIRTEPPLTPQSLMGDRAGLTIERLMKEST